MGSFKGKANSKGGGGAGGSFEIPPAKSLPAVVIGLIDCGTHADDYDGKAKKARKVFVVWELTTAKMSGTKGNFVVGRMFTLSFHEKAALRKVLEKWRGRTYAEGEDIDLAAIMGKACLCSIVHDQKGDRTYYKVDSISQVPDGMTVAKATREKFSWEMGAGDPPDYEWLPYHYGESIADFIKQSDEWKAHERGEDRQAAGVGTNGRGDADEGAAAGKDEIPF
jgi:hypothetical protein